MSRRPESIAGRILRVWTEQIGTTLAADTAIGATSITVDDASPLNDDGAGGSVLIGTQVVAYTTVNDDTGVVTLAAALTEAHEADDDVTVWDTLYGQVDTVQLADVVVDGSDHNFDPIRAVVSDLISDLVDGDRGKDAEACVLERDGDEWELIRVKGRPVAARGHQWEADDYHLLTPSDVTAGSFTFQLSHLPVPESVQATWEGLVQRPEDFSYDTAGLVSWALEGREPVGSRFDFHYEYLQGLSTPPLVDDSLPPPTPFTPVAYGSTWQALVQGWGGSGPNSTLVATYSDPDFDDSGWTALDLPAGRIHPTDTGYSQSPGGPWPAMDTTFSAYQEVWLRRELPAGGRIKARPDADVWVYWNGVLKNGPGGWPSSSGIGVIHERPTLIAGDAPVPVTVTGSGVLLVYLHQHVRGGTDGLYFDLEVTEP